MSEITDKLDKEIAELEELQGYEKTKVTQEKEGEPGESVVADQSAPEADLVTPESVPTTIDPLTPEKQAEQKPKKKERISWKKRYINLKQYHDTERQRDRLKISQLLTKVTELERDLIASRAKLTEALAAKQPSITDLATKEEINVLGEEGVSSIDKLTKKAIESATAPLKKELAALQQKQLAKTEEEAISLAQESYNHFLSSLANLIPDYAVLDADPKFEEYLKKVDPQSGRIRLELFKQAESAGDVGRVAYFFQEFKKTKDPAKQKLEQAVTPIGSQSSPLDNQGSHREAIEYMSMEQYNRFMDDVTKGRFRGKRSEQEAIEAKFDKAIAEGRMTR